MNAAVATVEGIEAASQLPVSVPSSAAAPDESAWWLSGLRARDDAALRRLHGLLLRAARFEVARRRAGLPHLRGDELDDIALEAAADALVSILRKLDDFRGASRFTTWAYKFALYEAAVKLRRRDWQGRELPLETESWASLPATGSTPEREVEQRELIGELERAVGDLLSEHQRTVLVAVALNGVPIDVLAERLGTTRGAVYKTLHDARTKLRRHLVECGLMPATNTKEGT
jgi:RNA polymerase sigma-70 factor, ECF subfamily